ncbi:MAG: hypothetical protein Q4G39_02720 [Brachymonas sp.]|nr:hypothetical protein [Brachymonas sp.]
MKIAGAFCPKCDKELEPDIVDLITGKRQRQWHCKNCGQDLTLDYLYDFSGFALALIPSAAAYWLLMYVFEHYTKPLPFMGWLIIMAACSAIYIAGNITLNYYFSYFVYKRKANGE